MYYAILQADFQFHQLVPRMLKNMSVNIFDWVACHSGGLDSNNHTLGECKE
jgi:hypothetical protein